VGILSEIYDSRAIGTCLRPLRRVSVLLESESSLTVSKSIRVRGMVVIGVAALTGFAEAAGTLKWGRQG
jgi:hypothetical protein